MFTREEKVFTVVGMVRTIGLAIAILFCLIVCPPNCSADYEKPLGGPPSSVDRAILRSTGDKPVSAAQQRPASLAALRVASQSMPASETTPDPRETRGDSSDREREDLYLGTRLSLLSGLPFLGILLSIALIPLLAPRFWVRNYARISFFWGALFAIPFLFAFKGIAAYRILHILLIDYVPFIILLLGLFTVSGGILLRGRLIGTPAVNTLLLLIGTILASWMGTTGASMLMIRPFIRANRARKHKSHVFVFIIFLISNLGGALTPLGDPPLFLGFLHGVPFFWTFKILPQMLLAVGIVLLVFYMVDNIFYRRESESVRTPAPVDDQHGRLRLEGAHNFVFLAGILGAVLLSGVWRPGSFSLLGVPIEIQNAARDVLILAMGVLSLTTTARKVRGDNYFTWFAMKEVASIFAGIFMTILPLLLILRAGEKGAMALIISEIDRPVHYFWATGAMSSFLDNAPTYLTFFNMALGKLQIHESNVRGILTGNLNVAAGQQFAMYLKAISAGAVFFGANTYIGNAPNFMVRSLAEEHHVKMPSFFGYMLWSMAILVPTFILITFIFFR